MRISDWSSDVCSSDLCFYSATRESCVEIAANRVYFSNAPTNLRDCAPAQAIDARASAWKERLPQDDKELWDFLLTLDGEEQAKLLAHCTSLCVNAQEIGRAHV